MRIHTLLTPFLFFALAGCCFYDSMSGHNPEAQDDPTDEPEPQQIHTYDIPLSGELRGTGLDLDTGTTDHWYYGPGECERGIGLLGWDLSAFVQQDLFVNDSWGAVGTDLDGEPIESPEDMYIESLQQGILVTTDQGAVFLLTDALIYGPIGQQRFSVTAELIEPGICDPHCDAGRFDLGHVDHYWLNGHYQLDLDPGLIFNLAVGLCGTPPDRPWSSFDLVLRPDAITAQHATLAFIPGGSFDDLQTAPDLASFTREKVQIPLGESGVVVVETDEGRVYKLDPVLDEEGALIGIDFARL